MDTVRCCCTLFLFTYLLCVDGLDLQVVTVATEETDGFKRFMNSAKYYDIPVEVVGMGQKWRGGDIQRYPGGGFKINLLKPVVEQWKDREDLLVMFVDSYDVLFAASSEAIIQKFLDFNSKAVFSAEQFCWPDQKLASSYPKVGLGKRFLCSGGYIGYAPVIHALLNNNDIKDTDDDQLYYTKIFLNQNDHGIRLDHRSHIFQNLNGAEDEVELKVSENDTYVYNTFYNTRSAIYHGNGASKIFLNYLGNYIPNQWNQENGCVHCSQDNIELPSDRDTWPTVFLALFVETPTPFLPQVLEKIQRLDYPTQRMSVWIHNQDNYHEAMFGEWIKDIRSIYSNVHYVSSREEISEADARRTAMETCISSNNCDYYFAVDSLAVFDESNTLKELIALNKSVVSPLLTRHQKMWSNFWGAIGPDGFYGRSRDYNDIVKRSIIGVWNVPLISVAILFNGDWLQRNSDNLPQYHSREYDPDMAFCQWMRDNGHFMYVSNLHEYGHLISPDNYETHHLHNDLYNIFENRLEWEQKYLHENYSRNTDPDTQLLQPCTDVYRFPLVSSSYTKEIIEELEHYGKWSNGDYDDPRLDGGYENVPTRDIHMNQIGFEEQWLNILVTYIVPLQIKVYPGYYSTGTALMNFVVKYNPKGQPDLRPHHDSATFTINVALTQPGTDYEGGGCRFIRQNCSVIDTKLGWALMHPGRLTHYHEGLPTTRGTRYIMVSFVDP